MKTKKPMIVNVDNRQFLVPRACSDVSLASSSNVTLSLPLAFILSGKIEIDFARAR